MDTYIVDACVLVGFIAGEPSASKFAQILDLAFENQLSLVANSVNIGEFYYATTKYKPSNSIDSLLESLATVYNMEIYNPTYQDCIDAAKIKATGGIAYFDCFNLVLAKKVLGSTILTLDKEYRKFENEYLIKFI